jgi:hypothetical protein
MLEHEQEKGERNLRFAAESRLLRDATGPRTVREALHPVRIYRVSIATPALAPETIAEGVQQSFEAVDVAPIDAGVSFGYGVGAWGVEPCVHIDTATPVDVTAWVVYLLDRWGQGCAYVSIDGREAWECNVRGVWSPITGRAS